MVELLLGILSGVIILFPNEATFFFRKCLGRKNCKNFFLSTLLGLQMGVPYLPTNQIVEKQIYEIIRTDQKAYLKNPLISSEITVNQFNLAYKIIMTNNDPVLLKELQTKIKTG